MAGLSFICATLLLVAPRAEMGAAAAGNWSPAGNMTISRQSHTATLLASGKVLIAGGLAVTGGVPTVLASAELFDPATNTWTATGPMAAARENFAATLLNDGQVLVVGNGAGIGGCARGAGGTAAVASPELYNPTLGTWAAAGTMTTADRGSPTATRLLDGRVLVAGGFDSSTFSVIATAELFDPTTGTWSPTGSMNTARSGHTAELLADGRVFVQGGDPTAAPEIYDPSTGLWSFTAAPSTVYGGSTSALLADGSVLLAGGSESFGVYTAFADRYRPSTNSWSPTGSLNVARSGHSETRLADGHVLVTGGCGVGSDPLQPPVTLASSETYDPASGVWTASGSMSTPRFHFTSTLLGDGRVLVAGGNDGTSFDTLSSAEIFAAPAPSAGVEVLPAVSNGAYGGYVTAATIENTGTAPASVHIAYYDQNGASVGAGDSIGSLPVNASWTVRQDNGNSFPSSGGDAAQAGSAVIYSDQPVAAFVNEFPPGNEGDATSYTGVQVASGVGTTLYAPTIVNDAYGGYTTGIGLLNEGSSSTNVTITYRDGSGAIVKTQPVTALAAHAYRGLYSGDTALALPSGFAGTATITSSGQPLGAVVNEVGPGGQFSSYDAVPSGSTTLNAPVALNCAFGCYYTGMGIQNTSSTGGTVSVTYYDAAGTPTVKTFNISGNGSLGVYQGSVSDGPAVGAYTATITGSVAIAAIVNEVAPVSGTALQSTSYNTFSAGSGSLDLPLVENVGGNPWDTGEGIMNTGTASTTVTVTYYDTVTGTAVGTADTQTLAPHAFWGLFQPNGGLPTGTRATAVATTSSGGQVAVICNESNPTTFMSYDAQ
jgi:Galactose oxidase, central domain